MSALTLLAPLLMSTQGLPFRAEDLERALALRVRAEHRAQLKVRGFGLGSVSLRYGAIRKIIAMEGRQGPAAARYVALLASDLIREALAVNWPAPPPAPPLVPHPPTLLDTTAVTARTAPGTFASKWPGLGLRAWGRLGGGSNLDQLAFGASLGAAWRLRGGWLAIGSAGVLGRPARALEPGSASWLSVPLRAGLGYRFDAIRVELQLCALASPYWIWGDAQGEGLEQNGLLGGAGLAGLWELGLSASYDAFVGLGVDVFANRLDFQVRGQPLFATERASAHLLLGFVWRAW